MEDFNEGLLIIGGIAAAVYLWKTFGSGSKTVIPQGPAAANAGLTLNRAQPAPGNPSGLRAGTTTPLSAITDNAVNPANSKAPWTRGVQPVRVSRLQGTVNY